MLAVLLVSLAFSTSALSQETISGTVLSSGSPVEGISVCIHLRSDGAFTGSCGVTDASGAYTTDTLPPGNDYVAYAVGESLGYRRQMYDGVDCPFNFCEFASGTPIELGNPGSATGIDFNLTPAASISGTVTSSVTGLGVTPQARLHALNGDQLWAVNGNPDGTYTLDGIDPGSYYVLLNNRNGPLIDELYDNVKCPRLSCDFATLGTQVTLVSGEVRTGVDAELDPGSRISGAVTINGSPAPEFFNVSIYDASGVFAGFGFTDGSGNYLSRSGLPAGTYYVANTGPESETGVPTTAHPGVACGDPCNALLGDPVVVDGTNDVSGIDLAITTPTSITGNITGSDTALGLQGIVLWLFDLQCNFLAGSGTDSAGNYTIEAPGAGDYYLFAVANDTLFLNKQTPYINQQYPAINVFDTCNPDVNDLTLGEAINLTEGAQLTGYDFVLDPGGEISGTISDINGVLPTGSGIFRIYKTNGQQQYIGLNKEPDGSYRFGGILPGDYRVVLASDGLGLIDERYDDVPCPRNSCDPILGQVFTFTGTESFTGIDAVLSAGAVIRGTLTDVDTASPIANQCVYFYTEAGVYAGIGCSDGSGNYETSTGLPDGLYRMSNQLNNFNYQPVDNGYLPQVWTSDDSFRACGAECDFLLGDTILVSGTTAVEGVNLAMTLGYTISGTITDSSSSNPIEGVGVCVHLKSDGSFTGSCGDTDASGVYTTAPLPPGTDYVAYAISEGQGYRRQVFDGLDCPFNNCDLGSGTPIELGNPGSVSGIDFSLTTAASISGTVTSSVDGLPVQPQARLHALNGDQLWAVNGNPDGTYTLDGIEPGTYYLLLNNRNGPLIDELYDDVKCPRLSCDYATLGTQITLAQGEARTGVDAELDPGSQISGTILVDGAPPPAPSDVLIYDANGTYAGFAFTNGSGFYISRSGLPAGTYYVTFGEPQSTTGQIATSWPDVACGEPCDATLGDPVVVNGVDPVSDINFNLTTPVVTSLSGNITGSDTALGLQGIVLWLFDLQCNFLGGTGTDGNGDYTIQAPGAGDYYLFAVANDTLFLNKQTPYINQQYPAINVFDTCNPDVNDLSLGEAINLTDGAQLTGYDFVLEPGGEISGTISDINGVLPAQQGVFRLYKTNGQQQYIGLNKEPDGSYRFGGILPGDYRVVLSSDGLGLIGERYDDIPCPRNSCDPVFGDVFTFTGTESFTGVDAVLSAGAVIRGTLTDADTASPLADQCVYFYTDAGVYAAIACSDEFGNYETSTGLPDGLYRMSNQLNNFNYQPVNNGYLPQVWTNDDSFLYCGEQCDFLLGDTILVSGTTAVEGVNLAMTTGFTFSGTVRDAATTNPIEGVGVCIHRKSDGSFTGSCGDTDASGVYTTAPLPPGTDYVAYAISEGQGYRRQMFNGIDCDYWFCEFSFATPIELGNPGDASGVDFNLNSAGSISGSVTDSGTGLGVQPQARLHALDGTQLTAINGNNDGTYLLSGIPPGDYYLLLNNRNGPLIDELYDDVKCPRLSCDFATLGTPININAGDQLTGYDAALDPGSRISGTILVDGAPPATFSDVLVYDANGTFAAFAFTDNTGFYQTRSGLPAGTYYVTFGEPQSTTGQIAMSWPDVACGEPCDPTLGDPVVVNGSDDVGGIDFNLASPATISGTVTAEDGGALLEDVQICVATPSDTDFLACDITDVSGNYSIGWLIPRADYVVYTLDVGGQAFYREMYNDQPCCDVANGTPVDVTGGDATIDFQLAASGRIAGRVIDILTEEGIGNVEMWLLDGSCQRVDVIETTTNDTPGFLGYYGFSGVPDGTYYVYAFGDSQNYVNQLYPNEERMSPCYGEFPAGQAIVIENRTQVDNIDFALSPGATISGMISDSNGPLAINRGRVTLYDLERNPIRTGSNRNLDNSYTLTGVQPGSYHVLLHASGLGLVDERWDDVPCPRSSCDTSLGNVLVVEPQADITDIDAVLEPGSEIRGTLTDAATTNPLNGAFVSIYDDQGVYASLGRSGGSGTYTSLTALPAGDYYVSNQLVRPNQVLPVDGGYLPQVWTSDGSFRACGDPCNVLLGDPITVNGVDDVPGINLAMELGSTIGGNVQFDGAPLPGATVKLLDSLGQEVQSSITDGAGDYLFFGLSSGDYYVRTLNGLGYEDRLHREPTDIVCSPDCNPFSGTVISLPPSSDVSGIDFTLTVAGSIAGTVTNAVASPLAGITVEVYNALGDLVDTDLTNASGEYSVGGLGTGSYFVRTRNTLGYLDSLYDTLECGLSCDVLFGAPVAVTSGVATTAIDFSLVLGGSISGLVRGDLGSGFQSLAGSQVELYSLSGALLKTATTAAKDNYRFDGLAPGGYYVVTRNIFDFKDEGAGDIACPPGCDILQTGVVAVAAGANTPLSFDLEPGGAIRVYVTSEPAQGSQPLGGIIVVVSAADGTEVGRVATGPVLTTGGGAPYNAEISGLPPGKHFVHIETTSIWRDEVYNDVICDGSCNPLAGSVVTVGTGVLEPPLDMALKQGSTISGTVTEQDGGAPVTGMTVRLFRNGMSFRTATTQPDGSYTFTGLVDGPYQLKTDGVNLPYINQVYGGSACSPGACPIADGTVIDLASSDVSGIDFPLSQGGTIFGYARDPYGNPIYGRAFLFSSTGEQITVLDNISGSFTFTGIADGAYFIGLDAISRYQGTRSDCHRHYSFYGSYSHCYYYSVYSTSIDTLYSGASCPSLTCDITVGTPVVLGGGAAAQSQLASAGGGISKPQGVVPSSVSIDVEVQSGHNIRGSLKAWDDTPLAFTRVYFFSEDGTPVGLAVTDGEGNYVSESAFADGTYYAATSRAALPGEDMLDALDAEEGVPAQFAEQIWNGAGCDGVCAPGPGNGTPIVISGADATGIDFVLSQAPGIQVEKLTNGMDADTPNGGDAPQIAPGATVTWTYQVTNTGGDDLQNILVVDDQGVTVVCPQNTLAAGDSMDCTGSAPAENLAADPFNGVMGNCAGTPDSRLYQNTATVTAQTAGAVGVDDTDSSHYCNTAGPVEEVIFKDGFE